MIIIPNIILNILEGDDRDYMESMYRKYYRLMFSTAWKIFRDKATVDDVVSDSCLALIKKISVLRELEPNKLRVYIVSTVRNTALNHFDKQQRLDSHVTHYEFETIETIADGFTLEKNILLEDELTLVWNAIKQLSIKEQQILRLKFVMELSDSEVAKIVGLSPASIRKYISRARDRIKAIVYAE